jgi:inner membrane protein involved in colicin E2 resistance
MIKRLLAIILIFVCASIAWAILGGTVFSRTYDMDSRLKSSVERIWGASQAQRSPNATYRVSKTRKKISYVDKKKVVKLEKYWLTYTVPLVKSDIQSDIDLDYRQKGLLWYSTYKVNFKSSYQFRNPGSKGRYVEISFPFPAANATYDNFKFSIRDKTWQSKTNSENGVIRGKVYAKPGEILTVDVAYISNGLDRWSYQFGQGVSEIKNFSLVMNTNFSNIDFPDDSISPTNKTTTEKGWKLHWQYNNLISGVNIGMKLPQKLQPGPLAGQISFFAPVSLLFFIVVVIVITLIKRIDLHPMHIFFVSAAFFAFHLLLAYLVDHISIHLAFIISSIVSMLLVVSYLRIAIGKRFAFVEAAGAQLVYLILFSYAFFFKGFTGLAVTIGAIVTLFVLMQMTARLNWSEVFSRTPSKSAAK